MPRDPASACYDLTLPSGEGWLHRLAAGQVLRIIDLEGNQAVDTLFFDAADPANRYSAAQTIAAQQQIYLTRGSRLLSERGDALATIIGDTCGRHDTLGGACAAESNQVRYGLHKRCMHSCRDTFLLQLATSPLALQAPGGPLTKRDLTHNVNFFMNVPVTRDGGLTFADGISRPGLHVEVLAERDLLVLISNCPQLNNPCNGYDPTPIRLLIWNSA